MYNRYRRNVPSFEDSYDSPVICSDCGQECSVVTVDQGIGGYEYWGSKGVHHDYQPGSSCCGAEVIEGGCKVLRTSTHTARKDHQDGKIHTGDVYRVTVYFSWKKEGPGWIWQEKQIVKKNMVGIPERQLA